MIWQVWTPQAHGGSEVLILRWNLKQVQRKSHGQSVSGRLGLELREMFFSHNQLYVVLEDGRREL